MKAATTSGIGPNAKLVLTSSPTPTIGPKDLLIEIYASSVNPKDWKLNKNISSLISSIPFLPKPVLMGDDLAGIVVKKGDKVTDFELGDTVYGMDMLLRTAACAEFARINQARVAHKPNNLSFSEAAAVPLAGLTALQALRIGGAKENSKVLIIGASGGVGTFAVQIAKAMGAHVTAVCSGKNIGLVQSLGADHTIDYTKEKYMTRTDNFDMIFDATSYESLASCSSLMKPDGIFVSTGGNAKAIIASTRDKLLPKKQKSKNVWVNSNTADLELLKDYIEQGQLKPIIDSQFPLEEIEQAYARSKTGRATGKIVIDIKQG